MTSTIERDRDNTIVFHDAEGTRVSGHWWESETGRREFIPDDPSQMTPELWSWVQSHIDKK
jgi:hypothetical protein